MYLQTSRLQYNLQGIGVFQTVHSDNKIQATACYSIISANYRKAIANCCPEWHSLISGSFIIQNGRLIGAVTHVLVNDPTMGYGIFIENMLDAAD